MDKHEEIHAFTSRQLEDKRPQLTITPSAAWWRISQLESAPPKLSGARLEGPSQGWPA